MSREPRGAWVHHVTLRQAGLQVQGVYHVAVQAGPLTIGKDVLYAVRPAEDVLVLKIFFQRKSFQGASLTPSQRGALVASGFYGAEAPTPQPPSRRDRGSRYRAGGRSPWSDGSLGGPASGASFGTQGVSRALSSESLLSHSPSSGCRADVPQVFQTVVEADDEEPDASF